MPSESKKVLISEPQDLKSAEQFDNTRIYLPYVWAILKSHWERHARNVDSYEWLEPIWENDKPAKIIEGLGNERIDVLGLSCYTWNWDLQCEIARRVKEKNPKCLIIAGGPQPDYKDRRFFQKFPYIDAIAVKDGENTFTEILSRYAEEDEDLNCIPGLYLPRGGDKFPISTGSPNVPYRFNYSPYLDQAGYFESLINRFGNEKFEIIMETNRGCPYSCSYCDWGSNTMSKIRSFDIERILSEIEWLSGVGLESVWIADANFGIFDRDIEIAKLFSEARGKYGYPKYVFYSAAKNNQERSSRIAMLFAESSQLAVHPLSIQHTNEEVLAATDRSNISIDKQISIVRLMMEQRMPLEVQLILGIPGDSRKRWIKCLTDLMEWGIHEDFLIMNYRLLPNAPAADPEYLERWKIETIKRPTYDFVVRDMLANPTGEYIEKREEIVVASSTYTKTDWIEMSLIAAFIKALHNASILQKIAIYLRYTHGVSYLEFYEKIFDWLSHDVFVRQWWTTVKDHYSQYLATDNSSDHMTIEALPTLKFSVHPSRWIHYHICRYINNFFDSLTPFLITSYPQIENLESIIRFQREVIITADYDYSTGKSFRLDHNWMEYFENARARSNEKGLTEPQKFIYQWVKACDTESFEVTGKDATRHSFVESLDWGDGESSERWAVWLKRLSINRTSSYRNNLKDLRVH